MILENLTAYFGFTLVLTVRVHVSTVGNKYNSGNCWISSILTKVLCCIWKRNTFCWKFNKTMHVEYLKDLFSHWKIQLW